MYIFSLRVSPWNHIPSILRVYCSFNSFLCHNSTAILLLGIYLKECELVYNKGTYTPMFIAALFTITKLWKQPRCPTTDKWIKTVCYLYTMEFYSATKKNEILSLAGKWMELENIILSEVSQAQKATNHMFSLICRL
jgi:hypothetical protein